MAMLPLAIEDIKTRLLLGNGDSGSDLHIDFRRGSCRQRTKCPYYKVLYIIVWRLIHGLIQNVTNKIHRERFQGNVKKAGTDVYSMESLSILLNIFKDYRVETFFSFDAVFVRDTHPAV